MKRTLLFILFCALSFSGFSQDYITFKNGSKIEVIIMEITPETVCFRYFNDSSRTVYFNYKHEIQSILFQNGEVKSFEKNSDNQNKSLYKTPFINELNTADFTRSSDKPKADKHPQKIVDAQPPTYVAPNASHSNQYSVNNHPYNTQSQQNFVYERNYQESASQWNNKNTSKENSTKKISFGLRGGLCISSLSDISNLKPGFKGGIDVDINLNKKMAVRTALLFSHKKQGKDYDISQLGKMEVKIHVNMLELPITYVYKFPVGKNTNLYLNAGPYVAYGLSGTLFSKNEYLEDVKTDVFSGYTLNFAGYEIQVDPPLKKFDVGLTFGGGAEIGRFNFGINCDLGLIKVSNLGDKNQNYWLSAGFKF